MKFAIFGFLFCLLVVSEATKVQQCENGPPLQDGQITISGCDKPPCRLRKKNTAHASFTFSPTEDIPKLSNTVFAQIVGIPFPFIGVDGTNACNQVYEADGETKASCPLKSGQKYVYKNKFDILDIYPRLKLVVHWALTAPGNKDILCFEVPARITN
ncbi:NPC intracellular cholesterol transporter 2 [Agrilus planipennis]|uniref:NPC intracellular cholesterol transporter 2 n=1 Tax=Agrilus planipennis TaxID=224129 RepID=A0A7F5RD12_AGRPL|nr:NPC intracellular cholesterol transporter 2 [Agrilus planipennis]